MEGGMGGGRAKEGGVERGENEEGGYRAGYSPPKPLTIKHLQLKKDVGRSIKEV